MMCNVAIVNPFGILGRIIRFPKLDKLNNTLYLRIFNRQDIFQSFLNIDNQEVF